MNILLKSYNRIFQQVMHIAIPFMPYREPVPLTSIDQIPEVLHSKGISSVLLVTDKGVRGFHLTDNLEKLLAERNINCTIYDGTRPNPTISDIENATGLYHANSCKAIISVGGGSSIDCAKGVGIRVVRPKTPLNKLKGILKVWRKLPLHIAIPTTAGTGSETTLAAVITDDATHTKYPINDFPLIPNYAVLDPNMTRTLPPHLTATTGMDALTHAVEAYIGHSTTRKTRRAAIEASKLILDNIEKAYNNGDDLLARANMSRAAYLAGIAFTVSYVGNIHALAHALGGQYHTPHGLANSVILPVVLEAYGEAARHKLAKLARKTGISHSSSDAIAATKFIEEIKRLNKAMNIPSTIDGIREEDIPTMARNAYNEANPLYPVPVMWNRSEMESMYYRIMTK